MKVLYIVTAYPRRPGDVITPWMGETIRRLRSAGVEVEVLAPSYRGLESSAVDGVLVHRFRYAPARVEDLTHDETAPDRVRDKPWYLALLPGYAAAGMVAAARLARRERYDAIHVHWPLPHALFGLAARWASGTPLVCSFYSVELTWVRNRLPAFLPFLRYVIRTSDAVTAISSTTEAMVRELYDREVARIPFGATVEPSAPPEEPGAAEPERPFEVMFAGRIVERKGVRYLLEAIRLLRDRYPVRLKVVGDGPLRPELERMAADLGIADRVHFTGFVSTAELEAAFAECDAFVLPAVVDAKGDVEGLGVVLLEALAYGKPVIASGAGGIVDIVRDGETGLLVPPGDPDALARAIETYVTRPDYARTLARAGREHMRREFSWSVVIGRLVELYRDVAARRRGGRTE